MLTSAYSSHLQKEIDKMLQAGIIKPVKEAIPWINSFILIKGKDKLGNQKLHICLDLMNLNKAIVCGNVPFQTLEDITHLIANSCIMISMWLQEGLLAPGIRWSLILSQYL